MSLQFYILSQVSLTFIVALILLLFYDLLYCCNSLRYYWSHWSLFLSLHPQRFQVSPVLQGSRRLFFQDRISPMGDIVPIWAWLIWLVVVLPRLNWGECFPGLRHLRLQVNVNSLADWCSYLEFLVLVFGTCFWQLVNFLFSSVFPRWVFYVVFSGLITHLWVLMFGLGVYWFLMVIIPLLLFLLSGFTWYLLYVKFSSLYGQ